MCASLPLGTLFYFRKNALLKKKNQTYKPKKSFITAAPTTVVNKMVHIVFPSRPALQALPHTSCDFAELASHDAYCSERDFCRVMVYQYYSDQIR